MRKKIWQTPSKQNPATQPTETKPAITPQSVTTKVSAIGKKMVQFVPKTTNSSSMKAVISAWKPTPTVATTDVLNYEEVVIVTEDDEVTLTEDEIGNPFQDTSSEEELGAGWLQANVDALEEESFVAVTC